MKEINWKLRLKNKTVLIALVSAVMVFATSLAQALGLHLPVTTEQVVEAATAFLTILVALGVIVDPTTEGIRDSDNALTYTEPKKSVAPDFSIKGGKLYLGDTYISEIDVEEVE